ncbi:MAG: T9SS type A sorting domain-containing protein [Ignavibacteria bacterium]|nr:T9SS type A sorting domain-containing protein [Ignavibacteria bacterium]
MLRKSVLLALLIGFINSALLCQIPFQISRLGTDYNGVIESDRRIIAYGNYGILTYSDDLGDTWEQINLGDFNHVLKIITDENNVLYALTPNSILFSKDNGNSWTKKTIVKDQSLLDIVLNKNTIYFITKNSIGAIGKDLKVPPETFLKFDDFVSFSKCVLLDKYLFIVESEYYIYCVDLETKQIDTIDIHPQIELDIYRDIANIKVDGNNLYVLVKSGLPSQIEMEYGQLRHLILKSTDFGKSWKTVTNQLPVTLDFLIENDTTVATLAPISLDSFFGVSFVRVKGKNFDEFIQNEKIFFPYYGRFYPEIFHKYKISGIIALQSNKDILVATGNNKTILISKNNGVDWELKSFYRPLYEPFISYGYMYDILFLSKDTVICAVNKSPYFFSSTNGGKTFLPISFNNAQRIRSILSFQVQPFVFADGTVGFIGFKAKQNSSKSETLVGMFSFDFGKTFSTTTFQIGPSIYNDSIFAIFWGGYTFHKGNMFILNINIAKADPLYTGPSQLLLVFKKQNKELKLTDTIKLYDYFRILHYEGSIFLTNNVGLFKYNEQLKTLDTLLIFPIPNRPNPVYFILGKKENDIIINERSKNMDRLFKYNLETKKSDSINIVATTFNYFMLNLRDTILISSNKIIYIFPDVNNNFNEYKIYPFNYFISDSSFFTKNILSYEQNPLFALERKFGSNSFSEHFYFIDIGTLNYNFSYLKVEPEIEKSFNYLFAVPPYPNPTKDWVETKVFWDSMEINKTIKVEVFDIYGRKYYPPIELSDGSQGFATVRINTTSLALGTYYLCISYGNRILAYPLVIVK